MSAGSAGHRASKEGGMSANGEVSMTQVILE